MRLVHLSIQHFKSIIGCELTFEQGITVLVGANEAGKTTLLEAIKHLDPDITFDGDSKSHTKEGAYLDKLPSLEYVFCMDEASRSVWSTHIRKYAIGLNADSLSKLMKEKAPAKKVKQKRPAVPQSKREFLAQLAKIVENSNQVIVGVTCKQSTSPSRVRYAKEYTLRFDKEELCFPQEVLRSILSNAISVVLLSEIAPIPGTISISEVVKNATPRGKIVNVLLRVAGLDDEEIKLLHDDANKRTLLPRAYKKLSKIFCNAWKQEITTVTLVSGAGDKNLTIDYEDKIGTHRSPAQRSQGNRWFFSFLTQLEAQLQSGKSGYSIILIDEPGLYLHPRGQRDLQEQFRRIASRSQLIYSTHMPFLVNYNFPEMIRTVEKTDDGTKVNNKPYVDRYDGLRRNIGITLCDSFILGERHLVVEGICEGMIIAALSSLFARINSTYGSDLAIVDLNKVLVVPAGDARYAVTLARFSVACGIPYVILLDADKGGRDEARHLLRQEAIKEEHILWTKDFLSVHRKESSVEDILPLEYYLQAVSSVYNPSSFTMLDPKSVPDMAPIVKVLESHFQKMQQRFDKQKVMRHLINHLEVAHVFDDKKTTLKRGFQQFEELFRVVNDSFARQKPIM